MLVLIQNFKSMLEKFKTKIIQNPQNILGGAADSDDFIIEDVIDGN